MKGCCIYQCVKVDPVDNYYVFYNNQNKHIDIESKYNKQNYSAIIPPKTAAAYYFKKSEKWECAEELKINDVIFAKKLYSTSTPQQGKLLPKKSTQTCCISIEENNVIYSKFTMKIIRKF